MNLESAAIRARASELLGRIDAVQLPVPGAGTAGVKLRAAEGEDWSAVATDALRLMGTAQQTWLIYIDELPIFLYTILRSDSTGGVQRVRRFLDWFRNDVRGLPECRHIRWLVTGSVGLDTLVQRYQMADTINSLKHESLTQFADTLAAEMVVRLANRYELPLTAGEAQALVQAVQWPQPYYLQLVFNFLRQLAASTGQPAGELISKAIDHAVQPGADNDFHHWEQRLFMQLGRADAEHAVALLTVAAQGAGGARPEALLVELQRRMPDDTEDAQRYKFVELRDILLRDAYWWLDESSGTRRYRFRLELLRRWWVRRQQL